MTAPTPPPAAERQSTTPPAAAEPPAAVRRASAPAPAGPRRRRLEFLASEGGLLLLSLMLALMIWFLVRSLVETSEPFTVSVRPVVEPGYLVSDVPDLPIRLRGPRGEVEGAITLLRERGGVVDLKVKGIDNRAVTSRQLNERDKLNWPFPTRLLDPAPEKVQGEVVRLELGRTVRIVRPALRGVPADQRLEVSVEPEHVLLDAPAGALTDEIRPDEIDLQPLAQQPGTVHRVPLTFKGWQEDPSVPPEVRRRRASVAVRGVLAVVRFEPIAARALSNVLDIQVKRDWSVTEITPPAGNDGFAGPLVVTDASPRLDRITFTGMLVATAEAFKDLEEHKDLWRWQLVLSDDDLPEPGKPAKGVQATLRFGALTDRFLQLQAQGAIRFEPFNVPVQVVGRR